jgi:SMP-30/Gluconolactonase/LRE-like region
MRTKWFVSAFSAFVLGVVSVSVSAEPPQFPQNATFTTLVTTQRAIEGLTGDNAGNLYTGGSGSGPCPIYKINMVSRAIVTAGNVLAGSCGFAGITFNASGNLFVADGGAGTIYTLKPNTSNPPNASVFATGVPGTNGLAFDRDGNLWTGDGTTGLGRVWRITGAGADCSAAVKCAEVFRIQPMRNGSALGGNIDTPDTQGVGRQARDFPPGTTGNSSGGQDLVANGIAFNHQGEMYVIDTARGALWKIQFDREGNLTSPTGCDSTFKSNTLCLSNAFVSHPILEGGDGIALDVAGNIWVDANERNAVAVVTKDGRVMEAFRNPVNSSGLRNSADSTEGNKHILEFPTSPFITGTVLCTAQSDGDRRDNSPRSAGEVDASGGSVGKDRGKISCMDQDLVIPGLPLPIR